MPTNYPLGRDEFNEPATPDQTPLSSSGTASRNHVEHHRDLGDAVESLQTYSSTVEHDHSGRADKHGNITHKLDQSNTHENADTDVSASSLHHTLGSGSTQAAPGDHVHDFSGPSIINKPFDVCTSSSRPKNPRDGMLIFETDTSFLRAWLNINGTRRWYLMPGGKVPIVKLDQNSRQRILAKGSPIEWQYTREDSTGMFRPSSNRHEIVVHEPGLYNVQSTINWDPSEILGDHAYTEIRVNGQTTRYVTARFVRGNLFIPSLSQTVSVQGLVRLEAGDRLSIWGRHNGAFAQWTYSSTVENRYSTIDMVYLAP